MTQSAPRRLWGERALVAVMIAVTLATISYIAVNTAQLGQTSVEVQAVQARSTNVANATRENLLLLETVSELGSTTTLQQVTVQRGLMARQMKVAEWSYSWRPRSPPPAPVRRRVRSSSPA
jgi:cell division protein FtsL